MQEHRCKWCKRIANYQFKTTGNWCCSKSVNSCPEKKHDQKGKENLIIEIKSEYTFFCNHEKNIEKTKEI